MGVCGGGSDEAAASAASPLNVAHMRRSLPSLECNIGSIVHMETPFFFF